ncbi:putative sodium-coupled neutral amino acid transporter 7 isoform X2 [Lingula anatina]|nr:putative sodium-coupled neutral amino acid transporter 7 isoform X2 [Lingula anatina]|eukprot:XP_013408713.1 putative sodium-coupled neutral amino acid transporter 7 isoform X2 [Lingula anatina]
MLFICGALVLLAYCSDIHQSATYQDVVYAMCGKWAQAACSLCIVLYCFGTCITFFIIIGDNWDKLLYKVRPDFCYSWYMNRKFTISITSVLFILPLCFPRRIDFLKYASAFGVLAIVYIVILIPVKYFYATNLESVVVKTRPDTWMDVFLVVPTICFGYQCHISVVPIYSCLQNRTVKEFAKTLTAAIFICLITYTVGATFGYLNFGTAVKSDILSSYNATADVLVAVSMMAAKTYTTYPILLFCGRAAFESLWVELWKLTPEDIVRKETLRRIIQTILWFGLSLLLAVVTPNIAVVIDLLGGLAAVFIFTFPGLCLLQVVLTRQRTEKNKHSQRALFIMAVMYLIIGMFIFGVTFSQSIMDDVHSKSSKSHKTICG